jgi:hypothetical protein
MLSSNSLLKQLHINKLSLSYDLLNEVKSYCFYDIRTWETMNFIKYKKRRIHDLFKHSTISRANPYELYFGDENKVQKWVFWTFNEDDGPNHQFQAFNCRCCGNYRVVSNEIYRTNKIICQCIDYDDYDDLPELIQIETDDDDDDDDDSIGF